MLLGNPGRVDEIGRVREAEVIPEQRVAKYTLGGGVQEFATHPLAHSTRLNDMIVHRQPALQ